MQKLLDKLGTIEIEKWKTKNAGDSKRLNRVLKTYKEKAGADTEDVWLLSGSEYIKQCERLKQ
jgi:hypothetical protein